MEVGKTTKKSKKINQLSVLRTADSFFYAYDEGPDQILESQSSLAEGLKTIGSLDTSWSKCHVTMWHKEFTLIHGDDYDPSMHPVLADALGWSLSRDALYRSDLIDDQNLYVCYRLTDETVSLIKNSMPGSISVSHAVSEVLDSLKDQDGNTITIIKLGEETMMIYSTRGQLKSINIYPDVQPMNILYYTTLLKNTFGIAEDDLTVQLSWDNKGSESTKSLLSKYHQTVRVQHHSPAYLLRQA